MHTQLIDTTKLTIYDDVQAQFVHADQRRRRILAACKTLLIALIALTILIHLTACSSLEVQLPTGEIIRSERTLWHSDLDGLYTTTTNNPDGTTTTVTLDLTYTGNADQTLKTLQACAALLAAGATTQAIAP